MSSCALYLLLQKSNVSFPPTAIFHLVLIMYVNNDPVSPEITSNLCITHAASEYVSQRFHSPQSNILPPSALDANLVLACDYLVDHLVLAANNPGMTHCLIRLLKIYLLPSSYHYNRLGPIC